MFNQAELHQIFDKLEGVMSVKTHPAYASTLVTASVAVNLKGNNS